MVQKRFRYWSNRQSCQRLQYMRPPISPLGSKYARYYYTVFLSVVREYLLHILIFSKRPRSKGCFRSGIFPLERSLLLTGRYARSRVVYGWARVPGVRTCGPDRLRVCGYRGDVASVRGGLLLPRQHRAARRIVHPAQRLSVPTARQNVPARSKHTKGL